MTIRWLHLSDVHECDREGYHREAMYDEIVAAVRGRQTPPDFVFFTGDLAFAGTEGEYESLRARFFDPLKDALPDDCPIFVVPGNHDVDRTRAARPRTWIANDDEQSRFQEIGPAGRRIRKDLLQPRFETYAAFAKQTSSWGADWLWSDEGSICRTVDVRGAKLAIVGINTAWLCQDDNDWGQLTAGRTMVDAALHKAEAEAPQLWSSCLATIRSTR